MSLKLGNRTITFDEVYNVWTSFHSYEPEWMERLGANFYTFKGGELYIHDENETRTNFYGVSYGCDVTYSANKNPSEIKLFKTVNLESNSNGWFAEITSELESGRIGTNSNLLFEEKEGMRYGYIRRYETDRLNFNKLSVVGLGNLQSKPATNQFALTDNIPNQVQANNADGLGGDELYFNNVSTQLIGTIDSYVNNVITVASTDNDPGIGDFLFVVKNAEAESFGLRGYHAKVKLINNNTGFVELFGANSEVFKSYI